MSGFSTVVNNRRNGSGGRALVRAAVVPCCRHCSNLGLSSDHWLRSRDGETTCPVLLANKCSYCHLPGHTLKLCAELKAKNERFRARTEAQPDTRPSYSFTDQTPPSDTRSVKPAPVTKVVVVSHSTLSIIHPDTISSTEYDFSREFVTDQFTYQVNEQEEYDVQIEITDVVPRHTPYVSQIAMKYASRNWADMSDSDEE